MVGQTKFEDSRQVSGAAPFTGERLAFLQKIFRQIRADILRAVHNAGAGHIEGPLSAVEMLVALYFEVMNIRRQEPTWESRDRFILSFSQGIQSSLLYFFCTWFLPPFLSP